MESTNRSILTEFIVKLNNQNVYRIFYYVLLAYSIPFLSFLILLIDSYTVEATGIFPLSILLLSIAPCSLIGFVLNTIGLIRAYREKDKKNKKVGWFGLFFGIAGLLVGVFGLMVIYVVTS